jgi:putative oxidoreductase
MLLIVGLASRIVSLLLAIDMIVAYLTSDMEALHSIFSDPGKFYNADPYTFLFAALLILIFGPGRFALDWLLQRKLGEFTNKSVAA